MFYKPDWSPDTIAEVEKRIKGKVVFEWGTGYSTIWLAQRAKKVYTMEHLQEWHDKIKNLAVQLKLDNIFFCLYPLDNNGYYEGVHYVEVLDCKPGKPDFIIVDGRNRVKCFEQALKVGCPIMLDDSERERYKAVFDMADYASILNTIPDERGQKATIFNVV